MAFGTIKENISHTFLLSFFTSHNIWKHFAVDSIHSHQFYRPTHPTSGWQTKIHGRGTKKMKKKKHSNVNALVHPQSTWFRPTKMSGQTIDLNTKLNQCDFWRTPFSPFSCNSPRYNTANVSIFKTERNQK